MATLPELIQKSDLWETSNVSNLLQSGAKLEYESGLKADRVGLLETYSTRSKHLAKLSSHHAARLKRSTDEFCENLAKLADGDQIAYARVDDTLIGSYIVWYLVNTSQPIGCLYVIGKSEVAEDVWEKLWNNS